MSPLLLKDSFSVEYFLLDAFTSSTLNISAHSLQAWEIPAEGSC